MAVRIAFFSGDITRSGGTERVGTVIANQLAQKKDYQIYFISLTHQKEEPAYSINKRIIVDFFSEHWINPGIGYLPIIVKLIGYLRKNKIDILIDIDGVLDVLSIPAKFFTHVKLISWEHFNYYADLGTSYRGIIRRLAARFADAIVTLTKQDKKYYLANLKIRHKIQAIHNPIDYMQPKKEAFSKNYDQKTILSVGRLTAMKGFVRVPQIAARIKEKYPALSFDWLIAGEGEQRALIEEEIRRWNVADCVHLLGQISDMTQLYEKALIYVMTSGYEGLPMVLLEAKMYQIPCVSFDIMTGPSEIIQDKVDGYLIPYEEEVTSVSEQMVDDIYKLLSDKERYCDFSKHTQDNIQEFRLEYVMECWISLFDDLVPSRK